MIRVAHVLEPVGGLFSLAGAGNAVADHPGPQPGAQGCEVAGELAVECPQILGPEIGGQPLQVILVDFELVCGLLLNLGDGGRFGGPRSPQRAEPPFEVIA